MIKNKLFFHCSLLSALCSLFGAGALNAATPKIMSQYGQIQNVQNYSSNPFWTPSSPYNQRMPQPVYAQGTDVDTGDCARVVSALVASYCQTHNNCIGVSLDDARPALTVQLASLPNHNYVTPCAGFIDTTFAEYKSNYAIAAPKSGRATAFPTATAANASANSEFKIDNPYEPQSPTWNGVEWGSEMKQRAETLETLQAQNGAGTEHVERAAFPTTIADASFTERMENAAAGYAPYKDTSAYRQLNIESEEKYLQRMAERQRALAELKKDAAATQTTVSPDQKNDIIKKIATALKDAKK